MGNVLCKNHNNRTGDSKNSCDNILGQCMKMCPNGIGKKRHFWEKQMFETAPPNETLEKNSKSREKNDWKNANLKVPDYPVAPLRKKKMLQGNNKLITEISPNENEKFSKQHNGRSVNQTETLQIGTIEINTDVGKSNSNTIAKIDQLKYSSDNSEAHLPDTELRGTEFNKNNEEAGISSKKEDLILKNELSLKENDEDDLKRIIKKERGNLIFAIEKHLAKDAPTDKRFENEEPCNEAVIVPVRKIKKPHICDDDEKLHNILKDKHEKVIPQKIELHSNPVEEDQINLIAPQKPQRDFTKYKNKLKKENFDTNRLTMNGINQNENLSNIAEEFREKEHDIKQESEDQFSSIVSNKSENVLNINENILKEPDSSPIEKCDLSQVKNINLEVFCQSQISCSNDSAVKNETIEKNHVNRHKMDIEEEKLLEECLNCMRNHASKVINDIVKYAEEVVNDSKTFPGTLKSKFDKNDLNNIKNNESGNFKTTSRIFCEEKNNDDIITELQRDSSQTINDICEYAKKIVNISFNLNKENSKKEIDETNLIPNKFIVAESENNSINIRPNRLSEIIPPTQIQQKIYKRSNSTQSIQNGDNQILPQFSNTIENKLLSTYENHEKSKSINDFSRGTTSALIKSSEKDKSPQISPEKILRRCLSTQSYLTPNLIEKIAMQANILAMPEPDEMRTNDGSSLVAPVYKLESKKKTILNSRTPINNGKLTDYDSRENKTAIVPPFSSSPFSQQENCKTMNNDTVVTNKNNLKEKSLTEYKDIIRRSPRLVRTSEISDLPKSKIIKRLNRCTSKQSNSDLTDVETSENLSKTLKHFLNETNLKPQEILDLIEFEFGDSMSSEIVFGNEETIVNQLKRLVKNKEQEALPQTDKLPPQTSPSKENSEEILVDEHLLKKSPDRLKLSRIPVLKNNKIKELQTNNSNEFRRHSIDDLDSWFNPIQISPNENRKSRKRENSLQLDYNSEENSTKFLQTQQNMPVNRFSDKFSKTKFTNNLTKFKENTN